MALELYAIPFNDVAVKVSVARARLTVWLAIVPIMRRGTKENWWVISNTIRMEVIGARTTAPRHALIPATVRAIRSLGCRWSTSPQKSVKARPDCGTKEKC